MVEIEHPQVINSRYRIVEPLGKGGMAIVYRAYDSSLGRDVAIKFLTASQFGGVQASERFMREARVVARLSHAHIMTIYDVGQDGTQPYLVLEYIPGTSLSAWLQNHRNTLSLGDVVRIITEVLEALAYAHARDLIHRDLKPDNILITPDGTVKVADFGLAIAVDEVRLTVENAVVGTVQYMAPELLMGQRATPQSDLYAVGVVLYEMLTGEPPFCSDSAASLMADILNKPLTPPSLLNPSIPEEVESVVLRLLEREPSNRYASADEILLALPASEDIQRLADEQIRHSASVQLSQSLLERIVRSSSDAHLRPKQSRNFENESLVAAPEPLAQQLLLYAAQEDLIDAVEIERRSMALSLETTVTSQLNLLLAQMNAYEQTLGSNPQIQMVLSVLSSLTRQTLQQVRDLEERLSPSSLQGLGLEPALEALASQARRSHGIELILSLQRLHERLAPKVELSLYRAAQTAIDRAIREGGASRVGVRLERREDAVYLSVADNGILPMGDVLRATRQQIEAIGGRTDLHTAQWSGLEFTIMLPVVPPVELTDREMDVIQLVAEGLTNKEVAALLYVAPRTIKFHLDNIFSKLGVTTRTEAAMEALRRGWVRYRSNSPG